MKYIIFLCCFMITGLIGYGKKQHMLTDRSLAGEWGCQKTAYQARWQDKKFTDYRRSSPAIPGRLIFKYENNQLFVLKNNQWITGSIIGEYNNQPTLEEDDYSVKVKIEYLQHPTENHIVLIEENIYVIKDERYSKLNSKTKLEIACLKIE